MYIVIGTEREKERKGESETEREGEKANSMLVISRIIEEAINRITEPIARCTTEYSIMCIRPTISRKFIRITNCQHQTMDNQRQCSTISYSRMRL